MILIASGAYLQGDFVSEVGLTPPSFLPIGNRRLYERQVAFLKDDCSSLEDIYLSIPASYKMDDYDAQRLQELGVRFLRVPDDLSLGDSILYCWNASGKHYDSFTLLHGDTLFLNSYFKEIDFISVHPNRGFYRRAKLGKVAGVLECLHSDWAGENDQVISGFFSFSKSYCLMKALVESKSDFIQAIVNYHQAQAMSLNSSGEWLDFGHINSFYHSRTRITTQRSFNELTINPRSVAKASKNNSRKIFAEGNWFDQLPLSLRLYTPALLHLDRGKGDFHGANYQLEYLYLLPLSDLFVFARLEKDSWETIFNSINTMLLDFASHPLIINKPDLLEMADSLYLEKTLRRLDQFDQKSGFDIYSTYVGLAGDEMFTLIEVARYSEKWIKAAKPNDMTIIHGDLCFSNILYDSRVEAIKCIDPRGITANGKISLYGDRRYELAKIYHSVIGLYDLIISGRFKFSKNTTNEYEIKFFHNDGLYQDIADKFRLKVLAESGYEEKEILAITIHLFLSMLPLHSDNSKRQEAFIANALRLFKSLREMDK
jgi:hypothetical protein